MFKTLNLLRLDPNWTANATQAEERLAREPFTPCGDTQEVSSGWVSPRGIENAPMLEVIQGQWLLAVMTEKRQLPKSVIKERANELAEQIEKERGSKPGKREMKDLMNQARLELLPKAFTKRSLIRVWIDPKAGLLCLDGTGSAAEAVVSLLVKALDGFAVHPLQTKESAAGCMAAWLTDGDAPAGFVLGRECELKSADEMRSKVKFSNHPLDTDDVKRHLTAGKRPTLLALAFGDRVAFNLTEAGHLKKIEMLDAALENRGDVQADEAFDADAAITTGELRKLLPELFEALGGLQELPQAGEVTAA